MEWKTGDTAPKDGTAVLAHIKDTDCVAIIHYKKDGRERGFFDSADDYIPDNWVGHWMSLPELPPQLT